MENGRTVVRFDRMRVTGDSNDVALDQSTYILFAYGGSISSTNPVNIGIHSRRGFFSPDMITLPSADVCPNLKQSTSLVVPSPTMPTSTPTTLCKLHYKAIYTYITAIN